MMPEWRWFDWKDLAAARAWAAAGNVAVHANPFGVVWAGGPAAHLLATEDVLESVRVRLRLSPKWRHGEHYDLRGWRLTYARRLCAQYA